MAEIRNEESNTLVSGTSGDDSIFNDGANVTISAGNGNDSIENWGNDSTILGGNGNDSVKNYGHTLVKIDTGAGDDTVKTTVEDIIINSGTGNDLISLGTYSNNDVIIYKEGDGNDTVYGFDGNDTLLIITGNYDYDDTLLVGGDISSYSYKKSTSPNCLQNLFRAAQITFNDKNHRSSKNFSEKA